MCYIIQLQNSSIFTSGLRILHRAAVYVAECYMIPFDTESQGNMRHESWHIEDTQSYCIYYCTQLVEARQNQTRSKAPSALFAKQLKLQLQTFDTYSKIVSNMNMKFALLRRQSDSKVT